MACISCTSSCQSRLQLPLWVFVFLLQRSGSCLFILWRVGHLLFLAGKFNGSLLTGANIKTGFHFLHWAKGTRSNQFPFNSLFLCFFRGRLILSKVRLFRRRFAEVKVLCSFFISFKVITICRISLSLSIIFSLRYNEIESTSWNLKHKVTIILILHASTYLYNWRNNLCSRK